MNRALCLGLSISVVALAGCPSDNTDGSGGTTSATGTTGSASTGTGGPSSDQLFVMGSSYGVATFKNPADAVGTVVSATSLPAGADTGLFYPVDMAMSQAGDLFAANQNGSSVTVYANARTADGPVAPTRTIVGASTEFVGLSGLALDGVKNELYVTNYASAQGGNAPILEFDNASTINGDVPPTRKIDVDLQYFAPLQIVEKNDHLFVVNQGSGTQSNINVFDGASQLSGLVAPPRTISNANWPQILSIFVDDADHLYVVGDTATVEVYDGASTLNGPVTPKVTVTVMGASKLAGVVADSDKGLYLADSDTSFVHYFSDRTALTSGTTPPTHSFTSLKLYGPQRLLFAP
jgi:hypothetical protein